MRGQEVKAEISITHRDAGQARMNTEIARPLNANPATAAVAARNLASSPCVARVRSTRSTMCRSTSRNNTYPGSTASEFTDQKLLSANRNSARPPIHPTAISVKRTRTGQILLRGDVIETESLPTQAEATRGARPSVTAGITISSSDASASLERLTSLTRLPASEGSDRHLVLDQSSSISP